MEIQAIKKYMKDNHITYDELSKRSGLSISTIVGLIFLYYTIKFGLCQLFFYYFIKKS